MECASCNAKINNTYFCLVCGQRNMSLKNDVESDLIGKVNSELVNDSLINDGMVNDKKVSNHVNNIEKDYLKQQEVLSKVKKLSRSKNYVAILFNSILIFIILSIWSVYYYRRNLIKYETFYPITVGEVAGFNAVENTFDLLLTDVEIFQELDLNLGINIDKDSNMFDLVPIDTQFIAFSADLNNYIDEFVNNSIRQIINNSEVEIENSFSGNFMYLIINDTESWVYIIELEKEIEADVLNDLREQFIESNDQLESLAYADIKYDDKEYLVFSTSDIYIDQIRELSEQNSLSISKKELFKQNFNKFRESQGQLFIYSPNIQLLKDRVEENSDILDNRLTEFIINQNVQFSLVNNLKESTELSFIK